MKRLSMGVLGGLFAALALVGFASAANIHLKNNAIPTFRDNGLTLSASGALAGLGNQDLSIVINAEGNVTATCTNPSGANQPPGQNPAPVSVSGSTSIPASAIKNGNVAFTVSTVAPQTPIPGAPDCPNPRWSENIIDVSFTSAVITVTQGSSTFTLSCTFSSPTTNGTVPSKNVSCS